MERLPKARQMLCTGQSTVGARRPRLPSRISDTLQTSHLRVFRQRWREKSREVRAPGQNDLKQFHRRRKSLAHLLPKTGQGSPAIADGSQGSRLFETQGRRGFEGMALVKPHSPKITLI